MNIWEEYFEELLNVKWETNRRRWKKDSQVQKENLEVGIIKPLFKKGENSNCSNYRGITLLNVVLKVYERIVDKRVREILDKQLEES